MTTHLKPCPFCAGKEIKTSHVRDGRSCGCSTCGAAVVCFQPNAEQRARDKWNERADNAEIARLREALETKGIAQVWRDGFLAAAATVRSFTTSRPYTGYQQVRDDLAEIIERSSTSQHEHAPAPDQAAVDWSVISEAFHDALNNGEGSLYPSQLQAAFKRLGIVILRDGPMEAKP